MPVTIPVPQHMPPLEGLSEQFYQDTAQNQDVTLYTVPTDKVAYLADLVFSTYNSGASILSSSVRLKDGDDVDIMFIVHPMGAGLADLKQVSFNPPIKMVESDYLLIRSGASTITIRGMIRIFEGDA